MNEIAFVLLADLHFGDDFDREAELPPIEHTRLSTLLRAVSPANRFFARNCIAHDLAVVGALPRYLTKLFVEARQRGFQGDTFDQFLLLGDIVTWPSQRSFTFARQYLSQDEYSPLEGVGHTRGLKIPAASVVTVPGNHDKLMSSDLDNYHRLFAGPLSGAAYPNPRRSHMVSRRIKNREVLFIILDANIYPVDALSLKASCRNHLARGSVAGEMIAEVRSKMTQLKDRVSVDEAELHDFEGATKILILHYAADHRAVWQRATPPANLLLPHTCRGVGSLVESLKQDLDVIVHGHLHVPRIYRFHGVPVVSVPSMSQRGARNGFYVLRFVDGDIRADYHQWARTGFAFDQSSALSCSLVS